MKLTLTNVTRTQRTSQRTGKDYTQLTLKSVEYGEKFINGFGRKDNMAWKAGDVVDVEIKEVQKDGKTYLNFEMPERKQSNGGSFTEEDRNSLLRIEKQLSQVLSGLKLLATTPDNYPVNDLPPTEF